ncbi:hypothetical protein ACFRAR_22460 [Kitasatospora sp. NPDC056651]|uniref:hypothetical protein n=1 Tax=Kitasatospora sp. NPDC056651 TaxID=3345892 RepID=UPI00369DD1D3
MSEEDRLYIDKSPIDQLSITALSRTLGEAGLRFEVLNPCDRRLSTSYSGRGIVFPALSRTIAVLGEMLELGETAADEHQAVGRMVGEQGIDQLIVVGNSPNVVRMTAGALTGGVATPPRPTTPAEVGRCWAPGPFGDGGDREEGVSEHRQGGPAVPGGPAADLVLIQPGQALGGLEGLLNGPAPPG